MANHLKLHLSAGPTVPFLFIFRKIFWGRGIVWDISPGGWRLKATIRSIGEKLTHCGWII